MKKLFFLFFLIFLSACDKYPFLPDKNSEIILGKWQWDWTICGNNGSVTSADSVNYTLKITFDRQGKYYQYTNDKLTLSSKYRLDLSEIYKEQRIYKLTLEEDAYRVLIIGDTLLLSEYNVPDVCEFIYLRK